MSGRAAGERPPVAPARSAVPVQVWHHRDIVAEGLTALAAGGRPGAPLIEGRILGVRGTPADGSTSQMAIGLSVLPAGFATPSHHHVAEELATVLSGTGVIVIDGVRYPVSAGSVVLTPSMSEHVTIASEDGPLVVWWVYAPAGSEQRWLDGDPGRGAG
jgi:mannose-6-phosphate isomerase-like protein (cupin superfamily)